MTKKDKHRTATGWLRPLNRDGRLIQRLYERKFGTLKAGRLIEGRYIQVRL